MIEEKRKTARHLSVADVSVDCEHGAFTVELFDVNSTGLGFSWTQSDPCLRDGVRVECRDASRNLRVSGTIVGDPSGSPYQPNQRSIGMAVDDECLESVEQMIRSCAGRPAPPAGCSIGLQRAWNAPEAEESDLLLLARFFDDLKARGDEDERRVAENLVTDPNCPGHRLRNLLRILVGQLKDDRNKAETPFGILKKAFDAYQQFTVQHVERDRLIHV